MTYPLNVNELIDIQHHADIVTSTLRELIQHRLSGNDVPLLQFFNDYTSWNGYFANGVCLLTASIGLQRDIFRDQSTTLPKDAGSPIYTTRDRSNFVASYIFDAARDEFDDHVTKVRDPHRSLAQAFLLGLVDHCRVEPEELAPLLLEGLEHREMFQSVINGYMGYSVGSSITAPGVFFGIGYHIGSEILADQEFTIIDRAFKAEMPDLYEELKKSKMSVAGVELPCYDWISIHSGDGHAVEQDHFDLAMMAAKQALKYTPAIDHDRYLAYLTTGFLQFTADHEMFFSGNWDGSL